MKRTHGRHVTRRILAVAMAFCAGTMCAGAAAAASRPAAWTRAIEPFRITGQVYYVGTEGLAAYLIVSPKGDILLDGTLAENAPLIERNIRRLGVRLQDVKYLLNSHAHSDHAGGLARLKRDTGARMLASAGDRWSLENGRHLGDNSTGPGSFPPVKVDGIVGDGETVRLGGLAMTAHATPGHTRGCTTWTLPQIEAGRRLTVAFPCSVTVAGNVLVGNRAYPEIAADYRSSFARLDALKADVVLTNHPELADVLGRHRRGLAGQGDAFVDPGQLQRIVTAARHDFADELSRQTAAGHTPAKGG